MLVLPIKQKWFEMIVSGGKKEEYREIKPYYDIRLGKIFLGFPFTRDILKDFKLTKAYSKRVEIIFRNGYYYNSPSARCLCGLKIGQGKPEWGAEPNKEYYILEILEILEVKQ